MSSYSSQYAHLRLVLVVVALICVRAVFLPDNDWVTNVWISLPSLWHNITIWCKIFILYSSWSQHTELGLGSLVLRAIAFSAKPVSTTEFRASPGRAPLGLILRLVSAVCGRGHNIGWREANSKLQLDQFWIVCWGFYPQSPVDWLMVQLAPIKTDNGLSPGRWKVLT